MFTPNVVIRAVGSSNTRVIECVRAAGFGGQDRPRQEAEGELHGCTCRVSCPPNPVARTPTTTAMFRKTYAQLTVCDETASLASLDVCSERGDSYGGKFEHAGDRVCTGGGVRWAGPSEAGSRGRATWMYLPRVLPTEPRCPYTHNHGGANRNRRNQSAVSSICWYWRRCRSAASSSPRISQMRARL